MRLPHVQKGASFKYLSRQLNFEMNNDEHMCFLKSSFSDMLSEIDSLPILPQNKLPPFQTYLPSNISWDFTVTNISKSWVAHNIDYSFSRYIRELLELPINATLSGIILSKNQFGLNLQLPSMTFLQFQFQRHNYLIMTARGEVKTVLKFYHFLVIT